MPEKARAYAGEPHEEALNNSEGHLSIDTLSAYYRRVLASDENAKVRAHIVLCPSCRALLLDLARFLDDPGDPGRLPVEDVVAAWQQLQKAHLKTRVR